MKFVRSDVNRTIRWLHIYSGAPLLLAMVFFAFSGFFLNHPNMFLGSSTEQENEVALPATLLDLDWKQYSSMHALAALQWLEQAHNLTAVDIEIEWEADEQLLILSFDGPSGSKFAEIAIEDESALIYQRQLPILETLNNLHRGKHVNGFWRLISDICAILMFIFCLSGLWLLLINRLQRVTASAWMFIGTAVFMISIYLMHL